MKFRFNVDWQFRVMLKQRGIIFCFFTKRAYLIWNNNGEKCFAFYWQSLTNDPIFYLKLARS